jgi:hypothetical protein
MKRTPSFFDRISIIVGSADVEKQEEFSMFGVGQFSSFYF